MRVLFDQGTPVPLRRFLSLHTVTTVYEKGWSRTPNGDLLRLADQEMFEVFLTTDHRLRYYAVFLHVIATPARLSG